MKPLGPIGLRTPTRRRVTYRWTWIRQPRPARVPALRRLPVSHRPRRVSRRLTTTQRLTTGRPAS